MVNVSTPVSEAYTASVGVNGPPVPVTAPVAAPMKVCAYPTSVIDTPIETASLYPEPYVRSPYHAKTVPCPTYMCGMVLIPTFAVKVFVELIPVIANGLSLAASGKILVVTPECSSPYPTAPATALANVCLLIVPIPALIVIVVEPIEVIGVLMPAIGSVPARG